MLFQAHSGVRYLVLLLGAVALVWSLAGMLSGRRYDRGMRITASAFAGILHLQILLGIGVIFTRGFYPALIGHISMMVFAAAVAQVTSSVQRRRDPEDRGYLPHFVATAVALVLVIGGIMAIQRPIL